MDDKENITEGLLVPSFGSSPPKKTSDRKTRSKSIGPGGLNDASLKEHGGNRRKSAFAPAGILPSKEDEKKRREARRKSLANRRVSFAPEATLHTWDVVEYAADATASSASSGSTRRNSTMSQASTSSSPASAQAPIITKSPNAAVADNTEKKRRRSSGIPPMNFNNPEDVFSSSPMNGSSGDTGSDDGDSEDTAMSMASMVDYGDENNTLASIGSPDLTNSSDRLEQALRQAATHAGTRTLDSDENGDATMELAEDEITASFKPWIVKTSNKPEIVVEASPNAVESNRRTNEPFAKGGDFSVIEEVTEQEMSMDMTHAIGKILNIKSAEVEDDEGATMEFTTAFGMIQEPSASQQAERRVSLKRRRSSGAATQPGANAQGSPAKKQARRSSGRRRSSAEMSMMGDETMDFTMAVGGIQMPKKEDATRRASIISVKDDATMEFTMVVGGIKQATPTETPRVDSGNDSADDNEDLSIELTTVLGGINQNKVAPATPVKTAPIVTPTNQAVELVPDSVKRNAGRPRKASMSPAKSSSTPQKSPRRTPRRGLLSLGPATPEAQTSPAKGSDATNRLLLQIVKEQASDKVASTPTPKTVRFGSNEEKAPTPSKSVLKTVQHPAEQAADKDDADELSAEPTVKSTAALHESMKLLSTPRKQTQPSPMLRRTPENASTPRKELTSVASTSPKKKTPRRSLSPKKQVRMQESTPVKAIEPEQVPEENGIQSENIKLQEFLEMNNIRFMDLTTTKRRHTAAPSAFMNKRASREFDDEDGQVSFSSCVVAAACTMPEFEMYSHACSELKSYIAGGKDVVRQIEAEVYEDNPPLFSEFLSAPPDQRYLIGNQLKNLKTFSRLKSKEGWYGWRSNLLRDLQTALVKTGEDLDADAALLVKQEKLVDVVLPGLITRHDSLSLEREQLQQRADELTSCDKEELDATRVALVDVKSQIEQRKRLLEKLQQELREKEESIEAVKDRKIECVQEIKEAERIREECRGWSASEVQSLKARVDALEAKCGWSIASASSEPTANVTMTLHSDIQLYFHPLAFAPRSDAKENASISLTYIGDSATPHARPLTTSKRFFLQLLRAHLQCLPQSSTTIPQLLATVKAGWQTALAVAEGVKGLEKSCICEESILSDERMAVSAFIVLPAVKTKVKATFEVGVSIAGVNVETWVVARAEVVYGEKYAEKTMTNFLGQYAGDKVQAIEEMGMWGIVVKDLKAKLIEKGPKGERV